MHDFYDAIKDIIPLMDRNRIPKMHIALSILILRGELLQHILHMTYFCNKAFYYCSSET